MTLNDLIRQCTAIAQQLSSGDIPLKYYGKDVEVELEFGNYDEPIVEINLMIKKKAQE